MVHTALEKRRPGTVREKAQYGTAFGIIAVMLWVAGFPVFLLCFVGILTFFIWKVFSAEGRNETRRVFEFYLLANELLREDDRRWYGFEIQETIAVGESIVRSMPAAPPLVHFALGALYQKLSDHSAALNHLARVVAVDSAKETAIVYPTRELLEYVRMLRKIERNPAEAPMTSSAIRSLERVRRTRGPKMLEYSREELARQVPALSDPVDVTIGESSDFFESANRDSSNRNAAARKTASKGAVTPTEADPASTERKTISEVLHDIYDTNIQ